MPISNTSWKARSACNEDNAHLFFGQRTKAAREICMGCPVRKPCLEFALKENMTYGVWGGTSPYQRSKMMKERNAKKDG